MGSFRVAIGIGDPEGRRFETVEALVDTGATFSVLPASLLRRLSVRPTRRVTFEMGDGRTIDRDTGQTLLQLDGQAMVTTVVFGEEGDDVLLGVVTMEEFLVAPDPVSRRLIPVRGLMKRLQRMGTFSVEIQVGDPQGTRYERMNALMDTGGAYTMVPASVLGRLGVTPDRQGTFELADGSLREYDMGETRVRIDGRSVTTLVVFGEEGVSAALGAYTLEGLQLAADPVNRALVRVQRLPLRRQVLL